MKKMKNTLIVLAILSIFGLVGCNRSSTSEDGNSQQQSSQIADSSVSIDEDVLSSKDDVSISGETSNEEVSSNEGASSEDGSTSQEDESQLPSFPFDSSWDPDEWEDDEDKPFDTPITEF